jgi:hypothetical protein
MSLFVHIQSTLRFKVKNGGANGQVRPPKKNSMDHPKRQEGAHEHSGETLKVEPVLWSGLENDGGADVQQHTYGQGK